MSLTLLTAASGVISVFNAKLAFNDAKKDDNASALWNTGFSLLAATAFGVGLVNDGVITSPSQKEQCPAIEQKVTTTPTSQNLNASLKKFGLEIS